MPEPPPNPAAGMDAHWIDRFRAAGDEHARMGVAWSYLLATLRRSEAASDDADLLRRAVTEGLVQAANVLRSR